jgi:hypothetical protein
MQQVGGSFLVLQFPQQKQIDDHNIADMLLLEMTLNPYSMT